MRDDPPPPPPPMVPEHFDSDDSNCPDTTTMKNKHRSNSNSPSQSSDDDGDGQGPSGSELLQAIVSKKVSSKAVLTTPTRKKQGSKSENENLAIIHDDDGVDDDDDFEGGRDRHSPKFTERVGSIPRTKKNTTTTRLHQVGQQGSPPRRYAGSEHGAAATSLLLKQTSPPSLALRAAHSKSTLVPSSPPFNISNPNLPPANAHTTPPRRSPTSAEDDEDNFNRQFAHLSNYRHLSKSERRRLLKEVKQVLGGDGESILSGYTNHDHGESVFSDNHRHGDEDSDDEDESLLASSNDSMESETRTMYTNDVSTAFYTHATEDTRTLCTADTSAFMSEDSGGDRGHYHHGGGGGERERYRESSRRGGTTDSIVMQELEEEEEEDGRFFNLTDACISYLCDGCDGTNNVARDDNDERRRREEDHWNRRGKQRRKQRRRQQREMEEDITVDGESNDSQSDDSNAITVKERRLASLKRGQSKKSSTSSSSSSSSTNAATPRSPTLEDKLRGVSTASPQEGYAVTNETTFWEGDGVWNSDPSVLTSGGISNVGDRDTSELALSNGLTNNIAFVVGELEVEPRVSCGADTVEYSYQNNNRRDAGSPFDEPDGVVDDNDDDEATTTAKHDAAKNVEAVVTTKPNLFSRAKSLTKQRSASPFVRAMSTLSQKISNNSNNNNRPHQQDCNESRSSCSIKTDPSNATKHSDSTKTGKGGGAASIGSRSNNSSSSISKKKGWREYTDPTSGKRYFSNGAITTWERPANVEITVSTSRSSSGTPTSMGTNDISNTAVGSSCLPPAPTTSNTRSSKKVARTSSVTPPTVAEKKEQANKLVQRVVVNNKSQRKKFKLFFKYKKNTPSKNDATPSSPSKKSSGIRKNTDPASPDRTEASAADVSIDSFGNSPMSCTSQYPTTPSQQQQHTHLANIITNSNFPAVDVDVVSNDSPKSNTTCSTNKSKKKKKKGWKEYSDPNSGKTYYSDGVTTTWVKPMNLLFTEGNSPVNYDNNNNTSSTLAHLIAARDSSQTPPRAMMESKKTNKSRRQKKRWKEYTDNDTGKKYYSNGVDTMWERPVDF